MNIGIHWEQMIATVVETESKISTAKLKRAMPKKTAIEKKCIYLEI